MSRRKVEYRTPEGVQAWSERCGFKNYLEASKALGAGWRSWYRWREKGLPEGLAGELIAERMAEIEAKKTKLKIT